MGLAHWIDTVWFGTNLGFRVIIGGLVGAIVFGITAAVIEDNVPATSTTGDVAMAVSFVLATLSAVAFMLGCVGMLLLRLLVWVAVGA